MIAACCGHKGPIRCWRKRIRAPPWLGPRPWPPRNSSLRWEPLEGPQPPAKGGLPGWAQIPSTAWLGTRARWSGKAEADDVALRVPVMRGNPCNDRLVQNIIGVLSVGVARRLRFTLSIHWMLKVSKRASLLRRLYQNSEAVGGGGTCVSRGLPYMKPWADSWHRSRSAWPAGSDSRSKANASLTKESITQSPRGDTPVRKYIFCCQRGVI